MHQKFKSHQSFPVVDKQLFDGPGGGAMQGIEKLAALAYTFAQRECAGGPLGLRLGLLQPGRRWEGAQFQAFCGSS